jgi:hypothetical protein
MYLEKLRLQEEEEQRKLEESRNISSEIIVTYVFKKTPSTPPKNPSEQ